MPYALFLASYSMGSPYVLACFLTLCSPLSGSQLTVLPHCGACSLPFYLGYSPIELWDSLSGYAHPGIACLAFQASDWLGTFWASLSGFSFKHGPC